MACCNLFPLPSLLYIVKTINYLSLSFSLGDWYLISSQKLIILRNRGHTHPPIFSTSQVPAALSFRNSLTDTYLIKFQSVLPNLLLVFEFVSSVHWPEEGFFFLKRHLIFSSYGSGCNKRSVTAACELVLPVSLYCHCSSNATIIRRLSV